MTEFDNKKFGGGIIWKLAERLCVQGFTFIFTIILARIICPDDFGKLTVISVFINILQVFSDGGLGTALIQKKDITKQDYASVFWFNNVLSVILYIVFFFCAPLLAELFDDNIYISTLRIMSISILFSGVKNVLNSYVCKKMEFKILAITAIISLVISGVIGLILAYNGFGIWALIIYNLMNNILATLLLWAVIKWKPLFYFSYKKFKELFAFGWKVFITNIIITIYDDITIFVIGLKYSTESLAYYDQGRKFPRVIISNINVAIDNVLFPKLSIEQSNKDNMIKVSGDTLEMETYVIFPIIFGLIAVSYSLIPVILTDTWLPCIPYLVIFSIYYITYPFNTININLLKSIGKGKELLVYEIIKKVYEIAAIIIGIYFGVFYMAIALLITAVLNLFVNNIPIKKYFDFSIFKQFKIVFKNIVASMVMFTCVVLISFIHISDIYKLVLQVLLGVLVYLLMSVILKIKSFNVVKNKILKRR